VHDIVAWRLEEDVLLLLTFVVALSIVDARSAVGIEALLSVYRCSARQAEFPPLAVSASPTLKHCYSKGHLAPPTESTAQPSSGHGRRNAATRVFHIPELVEAILLYLSYHSNHLHIQSMQTILTSRTVSRTWHDIIDTSTPLRQRLYLPTKFSPRASFSQYPSNPWITFLTHGVPGWQIHDSYTDDEVPHLIPMVLSGYGDSRRSFELTIRREQYNRYPSTGSWREMLVMSPPFHHFRTRTWVAPFTEREQVVNGVRWGVRPVRMGEMYDFVGKYFSKYPLAIRVTVEGLPPRTGKERMASVHPHAQQLRLN